MIPHGVFAATVAPDGSVSHGKQRWTAYTDGGKVKPGQRWLFRVTPRDGLQAIANFDDIELPPAEQLDRLQNRLEREPEATWDELQGWAARGKPSDRLLRALLEACMPTAEQLLQQVSFALAKDRINAQRAIVNWWMQDAVAASTIRTALEATAIPDPEAPCILVRRLGPDLLEIGDVFDVGIMVSVSPNGRRLLIRAIKDPDSNAPPARIHVLGLAERNPWKGEPYDIVLRWDGHYRGYTGILDRNPRRVPLAQADAHLDAEPEESFVQPLDSPSAVPSPEATEADESAPPTPQDSHQPMEAMA